MPLPGNVKGLLEPAGKLSTFKLGSTLAALQHQKVVLDGAKAILPWYRALSPEKQEAMLGVLVEKTGLLFKANEQRLLLGPTTLILPLNANAMQAGVIRKCFLAVGRVLQAAEALVTEWDAEDERMEEGDEEEDDEEERDAPPKRRRPSPDPVDKVKKKKKKSAPMSPPSVRRRAKARPESCPDIAAATTDGDAIATVEMEEFRSCAAANIDAYTSFLRGSAVVWHAHLRKCPGVKMDALSDPRKENWLDAAGGVVKGLFADDPVVEILVAPNNDSIAKHKGILKAADNACSGNYFEADGVRHALGAMSSLHVSSGPLHGMNLALPQMVETAQPEYREMFQTQDGRVLTRPPKQYTKEESGYRLLQFGGGIPNSFDREVHFYHMYALDAFVKMDTHDVKCVADYDKYIRQRIAPGFIVSWNPDLLHATWTRFVQARKKAGQATPRTSTKTREQPERTSPPPKSGKNIFSCFQWNAGKCSKKNSKLGNN
ncbi:hypothetical protein CYMTET_13551 [Cymbomonas tetramitiformis]|uniref:Uncharacterized protein n=1 Tax=Cymbomonas tetramitiformis TaxID=36881 RepID=A0AAE0GI95_9CHLO|nr:hypothetical protein CYMTET_13551 [Cymbomonas tetramitiformis]